METITFELPILTAARQELDPMAFRVLYSIVQQAKGCATVALMPMDIEKEVKCSRPALIRAVNTLIEKGYISVTVTPKTSKPNVYTLLDKIPVAIGGS